MHIELAVDGLKSLAWAGDDLIDWVGGKRITLAGNIQPFGVGYSYRFDAAVGLGDVGVAYETLGTKGRIMRWNGELPEAGFIPLGYDQLREIDRSYYEATTYAYPVCLLTLPDGKAAIAHCPRGYDMLDIELIEGKCLTKRKRKPPDIFHSRLTSNGRWLLSHGWVWQPMNVIAVYDVVRALKEPGHLSTAGIEVDLGEAFDGEIDAATLSGDRVIATASADAPALAIVELPSGKNLASFPLSRYVGTRIMAWGPDHIVALDGSPCVIALEDGSIVQRWAEVETGPGRAQPSVNMMPPAQPFLAIDPASDRFAIGTDDKIVIIGRNV